MKRLFAGILLAFVPMAALALNATDLNGRWIVTWLDNNSSNAISLASVGDRFSGTYTNDAGASCTVSGNFLATEDRISLQVVCPAWDIRMEGVASPDGKIINGSYQAYTNSTGAFRMVRQ